MKVEEVILEQWFVRAVGPYPEETKQFLAAEGDQFRNPVGYVLRENLAAIVQELLGEMNSSLVTSALHAIIRIRAVQNYTTTQAVEFIFSLRQIVLEAVPGFDVLLLNSRIDRLALTAFEEYVRCREQLSDIRLNESRRAMALPVALARARG
jgi:hypothetical protein